jgi:hypothetical protein
MLDFRAIFVSLIADGFDRTCGAVTQYYVIIISQYLPPYKNKLRELNNIH